MYKLFVFFLVAYLASDSIAFTHRNRRQSGVENTSAAQGSTTLSPVQPTNRQPTQAETQACIQSCPVTSEFNPVCGSNNVTYSNPGRLICAQACGVTVNLLRTAPCPTK